MAQPARTIVTDDSPYKHEPITDSEWVIGILASWVTRWLKPVADDRQGPFTTIRSAQIQIRKARKRARLIREGHDPKAQLEKYNRYIERQLGPAFAQSLRTELIDHL